MTSDSPATPDSDAVPFSSLGLSDAVLKAVKTIGYESASPIQAATIPALLEGVDILGQAQTGTGKTAAFALPILSKIVLKQREPQALVLVPTRELAIQVAEAFQKYASGMNGFHVLPIYGGQSYVPQLSALKRGPQVIVGTPGRVIDHLERGTLQLDTIRTVVLDEADEMLAMGFADAMEAILSQTPKDKQVALFSATMAPNIRRIAQSHLRSPREVVIKGKTTTAANIKQSFWLVSGLHKLDALTRIVEVSEFDAMLVFVRTKQATVDLAERLQARGFSPVGLQCAVPPAQRERTVTQLKAGKIDILVATDVAARGLDVERITHVVNFDVPYDTESYIHRIGRTGRAGRSGEAILFIAPRERNLLRLIERATRQTIEPLSLPTVNDVNSRRLAKFKARIGEALAGSTGDFYRQAVQEIAQETGAEMLSIAAAVASMVEGAAPVQSSWQPPAEAPPERAGRTMRRERDERGSQDEGAPRRERGDRHSDGSPALPSLPDEQYQFEDDGKQITYRLAIGHRRGAQPGNIVGAIANTARLPGAHINGVDIRAEYTLVRLPANLPAEVIYLLSQVKIRGQSLNLTAEGPSRAPPKAHRKGAKKKYD
jgi:ATP-dependent RNA helicase DeaD